LVSQPPLNIAIGGIVARRSGALATLSGIVPSRR
jgi:hypothetical protein